LGQVLLLWVACAAAGSGSSPREAFVARCSGPALPPLSAGQRAGGLRCGAARHRSVSARRRHAGVAMAAKPVIVVGSVNADIVLDIPRLPLAGETLMGGGGVVLPGGKGANQAVAAGKLGGQVKFVGVFGNDVHAPMLKDTMAEAGVDTALSLSSSGPSGQAMILLQPSGENSIILVPGANHDWPEKGLPEAVTTAISGAGCVMLQREIPDRINVLVAKAAHQHGVPVLLDLGGDDSPLPETLLSELDYLCPNETELQRVSGLPTSTFPEIQVAARSLQDRGVRNVLVTIGDQGSLLFSGTEKPVLRQSVFPVTQVVDTTGAGDCFRGAFALDLSQGNTPEHALRLGAAASSLCVQVKGAMISMPTMGQVQPLLEAPEPPSPQ